MSMRNTIRALPSLLRVGFADAVAYRSEMLIWILSTTMPLVMLALWTAVARDAPVGRFGQRDFVLYFLATFVVRQLVGAWVAWQMNMEIRSGAMAMRLLRPVHVLTSYAMEHLAAIPLRLVIALPVSLVAFVWFGGESVPRAPTMWILWTASIIGAWFIAFFVQALLGCLAFWVQSSLKAWDIWFAIFLVLSGYLIPVELLPDPVRRANDWLPFRYQIGLPVELMTGAHPMREAMQLLVRQWCWVLVFGALVQVAWNRSVRRFAAYGG